MTHDKLTRGTFLQIFSGGGGGRFWAAFQQRLVKKKTRSSVQYLEDCAVVETEFKHHLLPDTELSSVY